jgi:hypothetical protein
MNKSVPCNHKEGMRTGRPKAELLVSDEERERLLYRSHRPTVDVAVRQLAS